VNFYNEDEEYFLGRPQEGQYGASTLISTISTYPADFGVSPGQCGTFSQYGTGDR
jgi:hypothetical protein